jgi:hypothetical protein
MKKIIVKYFGFMMILLLATPAAAQTQQITVSTTRTVNSSVFTQWSTDNVTWTPSYSGLSDVNWSTFGTGIYTKSIDTGISCSLGGTIYWRMITKDSTTPTPNISSWYPGPPIVYTIVEPPVATDIKALFIHRSNGYAMVARSTVGDVYDLLDPTVHLSHWYMSGQAPGSEYNFYGCYNNLGVYSGNLTQDDSDGAILGSLMYQGIDSLFTGTALRFVQLRDSMKNYDVVLFKHCNDLSFPNGFMNTDIATWKATYNRIKNCAFVAANPSIKFVFLGTTPGPYNRMTSTFLVYSQAAADSVRSFNTWLENTWNATDTKANIVTSQNIYDLWAEPTNSTYRNFLLETYRWLAPTACGTYNANPLISCNDHVGVAGILAAATWLANYLNSLTTEEPPAPAVITASAQATTAACDIDGNIVLTVHATCSEDSVFVMRQYKILGQEDWEPAFTAGDTSGAGPLVTGTAIDKLIRSTIGTCIQAQDETFETRIVRIYSRDLTRYSGIIACPNFVNATPTLVSGDAILTVKTSPDTMLIASTATMSKAGNIFTQVARTDTTGTLVWRPPYSPTAAPTVGWTAGAALTKTQTRRIARAAPVASTWRIRTRMVGSLMDTTALLAGNQVDSFTVGAAEPITHHYYITRNTAYSTSGEYICINDTTQSRGGNVLLGFNQRLITTYGLPPHVLQNATLEYRGPWRNESTRTPVLYFGTEDLTDFTGSTVESATLTLWFDLARDQRGTVPDTLFFVGADKDTSLGWGHYPQYSACRSYMNKPSTRAWPDPDGAGSKTTDPITWVDFSSITTLPHADHGIIGNTNIPSNTPVTVDLTAFYQQIADKGEAFNGGIWVLGPVGRTAALIIANYYFYSGTADATYTIRRPVLDIVYTK